MKDKTQIEKLIEGIEFQKRIKEEDLTVIKESKIDSWNKEVEEAPYSNPYYGIDMKCAFVIMKGLKKGLKTKDALRLSEQHFKIPAERTRTIIDKYSVDGDTFYKESADIQRRGLSRKLVLEKTRKTIE